MCIQIILLLFNEYDIMMRIHFKTNFYMIWNDNYDNQIDNIRIGMNRELSKSIWKNRNGLFKNIIRNIIQSSTLRFAKCYVAKWASK